MNYQKKINNDTLLAIWAMEVNYILWKSCVKVALGSLLLPKLVKNLLSDSHLHPFLLIVAFDCGSTSFDAVPSISCSKKILTQDRKPLQSYCKYKKGREISSSLLQKFYFFSSIVHHCCLYGATSALFPSPSPNKQNTTFTCVKQKFKELHSWH